MCYMMVGGLLSGINIVVLYSSIFKYPQMKRHTITTHDGIIERKVFH